MGAAPRLATAVVNVVVVGGLALAVAGFAQAVRIGVRRGDWSGLIPFVVIGLLVLVIAVLIVAHPTVGD